MTARWPECPILKNSRRSMDSKIVAVRDLIRHRLERGPGFRLPARPRPTCLPCMAGDFTIHAYESEWNLAPTWPWSKAIFPGRSQCFVRVHSQCLTGDALGSLRCDCRGQLGAAHQGLNRKEGRGVLLYMRQEGRGIGRGQQDPRIRPATKGLRHGRGQPYAGLS